MQIITVFFLLLFVQVHLATDANALDSDDDLKRQLAIAQFRNKLVDYFRSHNQKYILTGVGYKSKSKPRVPQSVRSILDRIEEISEVPEEQVKTMSKILIPGIIRECHPSGSYLLDFAMPSYLSIDNIISAKFLVALANVHAKSVRWKISFPRVNVSRNGTQSRFAFFQKTQPVQGGIHEIKGGNLLKEYFDRHWNINDGNSLRLKLTGKQIGKKRVTIKTVILVVSFKKTSSRSKRNARYSGPRLCTNSTIYCCMKSFIVTPADLHLQNILSPRSIELNYCRGECNNYSSHKSNHAKYLSQLKISKTSRLSRRQLKNMRSCCTPMSYKTLQIQYREYSQVIKKVNINDMVVTSCACN